ncbi:hypothetical protein [Mailhella sp.]|uniref:hypothetical protein n=1 Tax=Mailhella sp. TaxID=1981029 RepID=UPI004062ADFD
MNNYYDVATPAELEEHFGYVPSPEEVSEGRDTCSRDADHNCELLAYLFADRGDFARAQKFLEQIKNESLMSDTARMLAHDPAYLDWLHRKVS